MNRSHEAHQRYSHHYSVKLHSISDLLVRGGIEFSRSLELFDAEWRNIQRGQAWAAAHCGHVSNAEALCADYADAGTHILALRQHAREPIKWCKVGLAAAPAVKLAED